VLGARYLLEPEPIGSGGFADVYRASDVERDESAEHPVVAIKVLRDLTNEEVRRRFLRELRLVKGCRHPNIVPILDNGEDEGGTLWYAMPLAKGSLADETDRFVGKDDAILHVMRQLCAGLAYAHKQGIYHRDLKPANVLRVGSDAWAISDFGLAREAERTTTALTSTIQGVGTFFFAAPEGWKGAKFAAAPADIYGLGKILHQLVTGELPIDSDSVEGCFRSAIRKATRPRAQERFQTAEELLRALEASVSVPDEWVSPTDRADILTKRLEADLPDDSALDDLLELALAHDGLGIDGLDQVIPRMSRTAIARLWERDQDSFRVLMESYAKRVAMTSWEFSFCDTISDFLDKAVLVSNDEDVLRHAVWALIEMGASHNRFHVKDVAVDILQRIRTPNMALAAVEAVKAASPASVRWTVSDFLSRSLHPLVKAAVQAAFITDPSGVHTTG
jgi:serine/threonine protein kinase